MDCLVEIEQLRRRLAREREARRRAEAISESGLRDLYRSQQRAELQQRVFTAALEAQSLEAVLDVALSGICEICNWPLGHAFLVGPGGLRSTEVWYGQPGTQLEQMRRATAQASFGPGISLPGRAVRSLRPVWINDITREDGFVRKQAARACGLRGGAAFPIVVDGRVTAVAEFFGHDAFVADQSKQELIEQVLLKVGMVIRGGEQQEKFLEAKQQLHAALANMSQGLCMFDDRQLLVLSNARFAEIYRIDPDRLAGAALRDVLTLQVAGAAGSQFVKKRLAICAGGAASYDVTMHDDGRVLAISHQPMAGGGWVETHEDMTEHWRTQAKLVHLAHHDALTDLPNRVLFHDRLSQALANSRRSGEPVALLCLDLDRFKEVNDTLGHKAGDELLQRVATRLRHSTRDTDTVARLGGDEFAIVQTGHASPTAATIFAQRLLEELALPYDLMGRQMVAAASIGVAIGPQDGADGDTLLRNADLAMYRAKANGRGNYSFYEPAMHAAMQARLELETDLRQAFSRDEFVVYYQPVVDSRTWIIRGFEALVRWRHPIHGMRSPAEFIPMSEEIGLINALGIWVLRRACRDAAAWSQPVMVAVNLSSLQIRPELPAEVAQALRDSGLPASRLELEVTESVLISESQATLAILHALKSMGIRIVMDDFGTGYSSLSYLRQFPFDRVKIDRSFVTELGQRADRAAIVTAVVDLCQSLGMAITAEGVETEMHLAEIAGSRAVSVQGYLFGRPGPNGEVDDILGMPAVDALPRRTPAQ